MTLDLSVELGEGQVHLCTVERLALGTHGFCWDSGIGLELEFEQHSKFYCCHSLHLSHLLFAQALPLNSLVAHLG